MGEADDLVIRFIGYDLLSGVADRVAGALGNFRDAAERNMNRVERTAFKVGEVMTGVGLIAMAMGVALIGGMIALIQPAAEFQSAMVMVHTHAGLAADAVEKVSNDLIKMAPEVGFGPQALAEAFYHVQSASTSLPERFQEIAGKEDILRESAKLAAIGHSDLTTTTNTLISVLAAYKDTNMSAGDAAAKLNAIVGNGNVTMSEFTMAMRGGLLPVAAEAGITLDSLGGSYGQLTDMGFGASQAATYLRSAIIQMTIPTGPAAKALEAIGVGADAAKEDVAAFSTILEKAGVNQTQVAQKLHETGSLGETIQWLKQRMDSAGLSATQQASLIEKAFGGIRSGAGVLGLSQNIESVIEKEKRVASSTKDWSDTWDYFRTHDPAFVIKQMKAGFDSLVVVLGGAFIPAMRALTNYLIPLIQNFTQWVSQNQSLIGYMVPMIATLLLVSGAFLTIGGFVLMATAAITAVGPIGVAVFLAVLGGILGVQSGALDLRGTFDMVAQKVKEAFGSLGLTIDTLKSVVSWVQQNGPLLKEVILDLSIAWVAWNLAIMVTKALSIGGMILGLIVTAGQYVVAFGLMETATLAWDMALALNPIGLTVLAIAALIAIALLIITHWDVVKKFFFTFIAQLGKGFSDFGTHVRWDFDQIAIKVTEVNIGILDVLSHLPGPAGEEFRKLKDIATGHLTQLQGDAAVQMDKLNGVVVAKAKNMQVSVNLSTLQMKLQSVQHMEDTGALTEARAEKMKTDIQGQIDDLRASMKTTGEGMKNDFVNTVDSMSTTSLDSIKVTRRDMKDEFDGMATESANKARDMKNGVADQAREMHKEMVGSSIIPDMVNGIIDWFKKLPDQVGQIMDGWKTGVTTATTTMWTDATTATSTGFTSVVSTVSAGMQSALDAVTGFASAFMSAGASIAQGVASGISSGAGAIVGAVGGALAGALAAGKAAMGISSPSQVFHLQVGVPMMQGVATGIAAGSSDALAATHNAFMLQRKAIEEFQQYQAERGTASMPEQKREVMAKKLQYDFAQSGLHMDQVGNITGQISDPGMVATPTTTTPTPAPIKIDYTPPAGGSVSPSYGGGGSSIDISPLTKALTDLLSELQGFHGDSNNRSASIQQTIDNASRHISEAVEGGSHSMLGSIVSGVRAS